MLITINNVSIAQYADTGSAIFLAAGSLDITNSIGQRSECRFTVIDQAGAQHFEQGNPVYVLTDDGTVVYSGVVSTSDEQPDAGVNGDTVLVHSVTCADWHYLADKRRIPYTASGKTADAIVADVLAQVLGNEGVYAVRNLFSANQSDVETDTTGLVTVNAATLTRDTTEHWHGAASLKVVTPGVVADEGFSAQVTVAGGNFIGGQPYTASVYLKGSGTVRLLLTGAPGGHIYARRQPIVLTSTWTRYSVTTTLTNPLTDTKYGLQVDTLTTQAVTFWADGLQIEPRAFASWPGATNILTANQSSIETDTRGYQTVASTLLASGAATITRDTTKKQSGSASLHVNSGANGGSKSGVELMPGFPVAGGATITLSFSYQTGASGGWELALFDYTNSITPDGVGTGIALATSANGWTRATFTFTQHGWATSAEMRFCLRNAGANKDLWLDSVQVELAASASVWSAGLPGPATDWELGGTTTVAAGPTVNEFTSNYATCADVLDALAQAATFYWQIDEYKRLWFTTPATVTAPWSATAADMDRDSIKFARANPLYRNREIIIGGTDTTSTQGQGFLGDGHTQSWSLGYPLAAAPTVTVDSVSKTVGVKGVDTGKDFYYAVGDPVIAQDSAGTVLTTANVLGVTYTGLFPVTVQSDASSEQDQQQSREGGVGTGLVEDVVEDATLTTSAAAFQKASGYLSRYATLAGTLTFKTNRSGLKQGQLLTVTLPAFGLDSDTLLIETVDIVDEDSGGYGMSGGPLIYSVTAMQGPVNTSWVQFFGGIAAGAKATSIDNINLGASSTLVILASFTGAIPWAGTFTATVTTINYPGATLFPGATVIP